MRCMNDGCWAPERHLFWGVFPVRTVFVTVLLPRWEAIYSSKRATFSRGDLTCSETKSDRIILMAVRELARGLPRVPRPISHWRVLRREPSRRFFTTWMTMESEEESGARSGQITIVVFIYFILITLCESQARERSLCLDSDLHKKLENCNMTATCSLINPSRASLL